jgi:hypothetical protein
VSRKVPFGALPTAVLTAETITASFIFRSYRLEAGVARRHSFPA